MAELDLFPLSTTLFPQQMLNLQIFEQRYLDLVARCQRNDVGFGIVQIREGREVGEVPQVFQVGVEAKILDCRDKGNGMLALSVLGNRKFTLQQSRVGPDNLLVGDVTWLAAEPEIEVDARYQNLVDLFQQLMQHPAITELDFLPAEHASLLGWQLSRLLPLSNPEKIALLALGDPEARLDELQVLLHKL